MAYSELRSISTGRFAIEQSRCVLACDFSHVVRVCLVAERRDDRPSREAQEGAYGIGTSDSGQDSL